MLKIVFDDTDMKKRMYPLKNCLTIELDGVSNEVSPINLRLCIILILDFFSIMNMDSMSCARCDDGFEPKAKIVNSNGELYHPECFV